MAKEIYWQDQSIRESDHIYRSGQNSAISQTAADSKLKQRYRIRPDILSEVVQPYGDNGDYAARQSSDKYYAVRESKTATSNLIRTDNAARFAPRQGDSGFQAASHNPAVHVVEIGREQDIKSKMEEGIQAMLAGVSSVQVLCWDKDWIPKARVLVDYAVVRGRIAEDQGRAFQYGTPCSAVGGNTAEETGAGVSSPFQGVSSGLQALQDPADIMAAKAAEGEVGLDSDIEEVEELLASLSAVPPAAGRDEECEAESEELEGRDDGDSGVDDGGSQTS